MPCRVTAIVKRVVENDDGLGGSDGGEVELKTSPITGNLYARNAQFNRDEAIPGTVTKQERVFSVPIGSGIRINDIVYLPANRVTLDAVRCLVTDVRGYETDIQATLEVGTMTANDPVDPSA